MLSQLIAASTTEICVQRYISITVENRPLNATVNGTPLNNYRMTSTQNRQSSKVEINRSNLLVAVEYLSHLSNNSIGHFWLHI